MGAGFLLARFMEKGGSLKYSAVIKLDKLIKFDEYVASHLFGPDKLENPDGYILN